MHRLVRFGMANLAIALLTGVLPVSATLAQQAPPSRPTAEECQSVLPSRTADPVLAKYRERFQVARDNMIKEERTLIGLLAAENTTRAAAEGQVTKVNDARNALARVRLDMLWELRSVVPAQNREQAFRCAGRLLFRRR